MKSIEERIKDVEEEIKKTPRNKATEHHLGVLKGKLSKLKNELEKSQAQRTGGAKGYTVKKTGHATAVLIGFPSVGKSTLLNRITNAESKTADYEFTTITAIPGTLEHKNVKVQIIDLPGIIGEASKGKGKGREILSVVRNADLVIILLDARDASKEDVIKKELYDAGIRLNQSPPRITLIKKDRGGLNVSSVTKQDLDMNTIKSVFLEHKIVNADIILKENVSLERLIDFLASNRHYAPSITIVNKVDLVSTEKRKEIKADLLISAKNDFNVEDLKDLIIDKLSFIRVYLKKHGFKPDFKEPLIMNGPKVTVLDVCNRIHRSIKDSFRFAKVWGKSSAFPGQQLGINHQLEDEDVVELYY